jgi:hypothetical protein
MIFYHFLAPKWLPKLMKNSTFSLLLGESFFDIDFEVIFRFFVFLERPTLNPLAMAQSKRMSALFRILGKKKHKSVENQSKNGSKIIQIL